MVSKQNQADNNSKMKKQNNKIKGKITTLQQNNKDNKTAK